MTKQLRHKSNLLNYAWGVLRVQYLVSMALRGASEMVQKVSGVHAFLQALPEALSRETECWRYCTLAEAWAEAEHQSALLQWD